MNRIRKAIKALCDNGFHPASSCNIEGWGAAIAIGASAAAGIAGSAISANAQKNAASKAANAQEQAAEDQLSLDSNVFNAQTQMSSSARALGGEAQSREAYLLGLDPNLNISGDLSTPTISTGIGGSSLGWSGPLGTGNSTDLSSVFGSSSGSGSGGSTPTASSTNLAGVSGTGGAITTNSTGANAWGSGTPGTTSTAAGTSSGFGSFSNPYNPSTFYQDPGYQFVLGTGINTINNQQASTGLALSPSALPAALNYTTGLASQEFNNAYNRSMNTQTTQLNELNSLINGGQVATSGVSSAASNLGSAGSSALAGYGNASAAGTIGGANALSSGINGATNTLSSAINYGVNNGTFSSSNPYNYGNFNVNNATSAAGYTNSQGLLNTDMNGNLVTTP